jgi:hypothetical protein
MLSLRRLIGSSTFQPTADEVKRLSGLLWRAKTRQRPGLLDALPDEIYAEFDNRCALCSTLSSKLEIHHIVPWREALLLADGDHGQRHNLILLCIGHHRLADDEQIPRDALFSRPTGGIASVRTPFDQVRNASEFELGIALGLHRQLQRALEADGRRAASTHSRAQSLFLAACAARRVGSKGIRRSWALLDEAQRQLTDNRLDHETRAGIAYERGKIAVLCNEFRVAAHFFGQCEATTSNELMFKRARHSRMWAPLREEHEGAGAPEVSLRTECGIAHFEHYRQHLTGSIVGVKWYVYNLLDCGEQFALTGDWKTSLEYLADAQEWIDRLGIRALRAQLYRNVALACQARGDHWRAALAASASLELHHVMKIQEHKAATLLVYVQALHALDLKKCLAAALEAERIDEDMDNQWAITQLGQLRFVN